MGGRERPRAGAGRGEQGNGRRDESVNGRGGPGVGEPRKAQGGQRFFFHQCLGRHSAGGPQSEGFLEAEAEGTELPPSPILCPCRVSWLSGARGQRVVRAGPVGWGGFLKLPTRPPTEGRKGMGVPGLQEGCTGSGARGEADLRLEGLDRP